MTPLKEIESWCYKQIELKNRLYDIKDFPGEVEFCGMLDKKDIANAKRIHIYVGIERIAAALKLPIRIEPHDCDTYQRTVSHLGVTFFQLGYYVA